MKNTPLRPAESLAELRGALESSAPPTVIVLTNSPSARAEDPHLFELALRRIVGFAEEARGALVHYDAAVSGFDPRELYGALTTKSLFASTSLRILKNADALMKGLREANGARDAADAGDDPDPQTPQKRSREAASHPLEKATLAFAKGAAVGEQFVLVARKLRAPFVRAVREAGGLVIEFRALYDKPFQGAGPIETTELGEFAKALAREQGMRLGSGALAALLARTGNQLGSIDAGLQKLRSVCGDRDVSSADVVLHVAATRPGSPWILGESILAGDAKRAMNEWALIGRSGARDGDGKSIAPEGAFVMALAAAVRDARRNHEAARRIRCGMSLEQAAASVGVPFFPAAMETFARALRARSLAGHRRLLDDLLHTELSVRLHREPIASALERLVARARVNANEARAGVEAR